VGEVVFGECKWSNRLVDTDVYFDLKRKASKVSWNKNERKEYFILFSKSGFTKKMINLSIEDNIFLVREGNLI
jgi:hypothetical protein